MTQARGAKKKTSSSNRRANMEEAMAKAEREGRVYHLAGANRNAGGHEEMSAKKENSSHFSREIARASEYRNESREANRKSVKPTYHGHAAEGAGSHGGDSQRGKYVPSHNKTNTRNLVSQREKYGTGKSRTINARGGHEPAGATGGRKRSSGVRRDMSRGLTSGDLRRAGEEARKGINAIGDAITKQIRQSPTSSQRPGEGGREWGNHKYIDKVRTKSGKIRYIYDINTAGGSMTDVNKLNADKAKKRKQVGAKNLKATEAGSRNREAQTKRGNGLLGKARGKAKAFLKWIGR